MAPKAPLRSTGALTGNASVIFVGSCQPYVRGRHFLAHLVDQQQWLVGRSFGHSLKYGYHCASASEDARLNHRDRAPVREEETSLAQNTDFPAPCVDREFAYID